MVEKKDGADPHDVIDCFHKLKDYAETIAVEANMPNAKTWKEKKLIRNLRTNKLIRNRN